MVAKPALLLGIMDFDNNFLIQYTIVFHIMYLVIEMNVKHFLQNIFGH